MGFDPETLFSKIAAREIPADIVYEDSTVVAFRDINPQAPVHIVIIPRQHIRKVSDLTEETAPLISQMTLVANRLAREEGIAESGYRLVLNCGGDAGQSIWHIHLHLLGGRAMGWPPG